jgi:integrase
MPKKKRFRTLYPGVVFILSKAIRIGELEKIYYIIYWKDGKLIEEKAGRAVRDRMTPAKANQMRARRMSGREPTNKERREREKEAKVPKWTISRLWQEYLRQTDLKGLIQDRSRFRREIESAFGDKEPKNIVPLDIDHLRIRMLKDKAPQTVKNVLGLLVRIVRFGARKGLCRPLDFTVQMPKVDNVTTEDLSPDELARLFQAIDEDPDKEAGAIMRMALYTGMRRGEIFKLQWGHVDFERGFIRIVDPKGTRTQTIPLNDLARDLLEAKSKPPIGGNEYIFPGRSGQRRTGAPNVARIRDKAGLPRTFRPLHGLRHTYASLLASSGKVDLYTLQKLMTHKSPEMTQRYAHLRDEALRKGSDVVTELLKDLVSKK